MSIMRCMKKNILARLLDVAVDLAYDVFDDVTDEHIEAIYERLVFNLKHGVGFEGATTRH